MFTLSKLSTHTGKNSELVLHNDYVIQRPCALMLFLKYQVLQCSQKLATICHKSTFTPIVVCLYV